MSESWRMDLERRVSSIENLSPQILDLRVDQLPGQALDNLGLQLFNEVRGVTGNWEGVAEELGISSVAELEQIRRHAQVAQVFPGCRMLRDWGKRSGSTVFVLLNALRRQNREDCVDLVVKACKDLHSMQLNVKIEDERGQFKYLSVTTKKDSSLAASLENVLSGLPSYVITGPNPKITWQTPAYHLKGTQLSVKKGEITDESERSVYGSFQISTPKPCVAEGAPSYPSGYDPGYRSTSQATSLPFNIPVTDEASTSNNLCSVTAPKVHSNTGYAHPETYDRYNNLSERESAIKPLPCQNLPSSSNSSPHHFPSFEWSCSSSHVDRQTLLKKPSCSVVESYPTLRTLPSGTYPKGYLFEPDHFRSASFEDEDDITLMKRCEPQRKSVDSKPNRHTPKVSDYVPHTHPVLRFSNQSATFRPESPSSMASSMPHSKPLPCVKNEIYVSHDRMPPPSSFPRMPMTNVKPKPCVLQQRKDGYIDVVAQEKGELQGMHGSHSLPVLRQKGEPITVPAKRDSKEEKERPKSVPDEFKRPPAQCVVSKDSHGYATFASQSSLMEIDTDSRSRSSSDASAFTVIDTDADGYLSYRGNSGSMTSKQDSAMEGEPMESSTESENSNRHQTVALVIQQSSNGYFGFSTSSGVNPPQGLPHVQLSEYMAMNRSESMPAEMPSQMNSDGLVYARFSAEDEEQDASYSDMQQMTKFPPKKQPIPMNRHWSANDMEYLEGVPDDSQYTYIDDISQNQLRSLPPTPSPPIPMKRLRTSHDRPIVRDLCDLDAVPGWCPQETEESICSTMKRYQQEDGNFIVWWIGRKRQYVITVSHLNALRNYLIFERQHGTRVRLYIFPGGRDFDNLKELVEHYMREGLKGPDVNPTEHSRGKRWQQFSHVKLRKPLRVKYSHTIRKKAS
ncbi:uncharacterized protein LOC124146131 isoform X1 [Haliotis rufescens]|uniref:uncharacterized protein LOC124146131 isoform X1 n=2 Tax=Haliotis rufescens TaxID=6454 RepID=UPI00201E8F0A|nr:uncharacterized protein LOC124146131 isoform X1 [Haliotis rufescens]